MTVGIRTLLFVMNWIDKSQEPLPVRTGVNSRSIGCWDHARPFGVVAAYACLCFHIDVRSLLGFFRRKGDFAALVVDADSIDSRLFTKCIDDLVNVFPAIEQHAVVR